MLKKSTYLIAYQLNKYFTHRNDNATLQTARGSAGAALSFLCDLEKTEKKQCARTRFRLFFFS